MPPKAPVAKVNGGESNVQELPCALDVTFPVWNLTEVENQTRAAPAGDFEDPDGLVLPPFLQPLTDAWKRPGDMTSEGSTPVVVLREPTEEEQASLQTSGKGGGKDKAGKGGTATPTLAIRDMLPGSAMAAGHEYNEWLLYTMLNIYKIANQVTAGEFLWENIWPKDPAGVSCSSPSGKYWVRMFVMNTWRTVVVDDRVPVDVFGAPLVVNCSRPSMLWPIIMSKAVFKLMHAFKCLDVASPDKVPLALWMTGWVGASLPKRVEGGDLFDRVEWGVKSEGAMVHTTLHTRAQPTRKPPRLMVIYGPSAVGRGPLIQKLLAEYPDKFELTVSDTSRPPKAHEVQGTDYFFRSKEYMEQGVKDKLFLECVSVNGHMYGTTLKAVQKVVEGGKFPIVALEGRGVRAMQNQVGKYKLEALYVHVVPPTIDELGRRIRGRYREADVTIEQRIEFTQAEMDRADNDPDVFETLLDHTPDEDRLYYELKVAISVLSPVIRNRLRGLPAYVLDYADVIPSNSVEKMTPKPVVLVGPSVAGFKEKLIDMLFEEFPEVFGKVTIHTNMKADSVDPNMEGSKSFVYNHCTTEELESMKTDKLFVTQKDRFVHPMLINEYVVTVEEVNRVSNSMHLSLLSVDGDGALQVKASKVDAFMIFIGPETIDFFKERLYASLLETEETVQKMMKRAEREMKELKSHTDETVTNDQLDQALKDLKDTISDYRPDVIYARLEQKEKVMAPIVICGAPTVGKTTMIAKLLEMFPDKLVLALPHMNREPGKAEKQGEKYVFVKKEEFERLEKQGDFFFDVRPSEEKGGTIGYSFEVITEASAAGKVTLLDVDLDAAKRMKEMDKIEEAVYIFIQPPSVDILVERMKTRAEEDPKGKPVSDKEVEELITASEAAIQQALHPEEGERMFGHVLTNHTLEDTTNLLMQIVSQYHPMAVPPFVKPLVIAGPYGSGKRTMCVKLLEEFPGKFGFAINHTTRPIEEGEQDGKDFFFITKEQFQTLIKEQHFVEWMETSGVFHGMSHVAVRSVQGRRQMCVIDSDVESAHAMKAAGLDALYVFIEAPPEEAMRERLLAQGEAPVDVEKRIKEAKVQMKTFRGHRSMFNHFLKNNNQDICYVRLKEAISRCSPVTVPLHAVWGFGRPLWDPLLRQHGQRPLKTMVLGPALSGKTTLCHKIGDRYDVPVISTGTLLRDAAYDNPTDVGLKAKEYLDSSAHVPDEFIIRLATDRIAQPDCVSKGWIFDGFPRTPAQIETLTEAGVVPDKVIFVECTWKTLFDRAKGRQLDPETGSVYNHLEPGRKVEEQFKRRKDMRPVRNRLTIRHDDSEENIQNRLTHHDSVVASIKKLYSDVSTSVDGGRPLDVVFQDMCEHIMVEDKYLLPENLITLTPVTELVATDYHVIDTVKFKRMQLLRLQDLLPVVKKVVWVELSELVKVCNCIMLNYRCEDFTSSHAVEYLNAAEVPPQTMVHVESPEPTQVLVTFGIAPPEPPRDNRKLPWVMCGPSGAGKSTLIKRLMSEFPDQFGFSVSHTTREPRDTEESGKDYHFASRAEIQAQIDAGDFIEFSEVNGHLYGTSKASVEAVAEAGKTCILDIDVKGAQIVKKSAMKAKFVFICPPSLAILEKRLRDRGTESEQSIQTRVQNAAEEMRFVGFPGFFDRVLMNTDIEATYQSFRDVVLSPAERGEPRPAQLLGDVHDWQSVTPGYHFVNLETTNTKSAMITLPRGKTLLRQQVDRGFCFSVTYRSKTPLVVGPALDVLKSKEGLSTQEVIGDYPDHPAGSFNLWMRQTFAISKATILTMIFTPASVDATPYLRFVMLDNDTGDYTAYMLGRINAVTMHPNKGGYTLLAYARPPMFLPSCRWGLLAVSDRQIEQFTSVPLTETKTFSGAYQPNKNGILARHCISGEQAQQLTLHFETFKECTFMVTLRKPATEHSPEEPISTWTVARTFTAPAVLVPALGAATEKGAAAPSYILDVRLVPDLCHFTLEHNGDIPLQLDWMVAVASNKEVEVIADDSKERHFRSIIEGWNAKDPKGRSEAAKAALDRMTAELEAGEAGEWAKTRSAKGRDTTLLPHRHHIVKRAGEDSVIPESELKKRVEDCSAAEQRDKDAFEAFKMAREGAHVTREERSRINRKEFATWRDQLKADTELLMAERDDFANTCAMLKSLAQPLQPEEESADDPKARKGGKDDDKADKKKKPGTPPPEEIPLTPEQKEIKFLMTGVTNVNRCLTSLKPSAMKELHSFMIAPRHSFKVVQAVMLVMGYPNDVVDSWTRARDLLDERLVEALVAFDPTQTQHDAERWTRAKECVVNIAEESLVEEAIVSAMLNRWLIRVFDVTDKLEEHIRLRQDNVVSEGGSKQGAPLESRPGSKGPTPPASGRKSGQTRT